MSEQENKEQLAYIKSDTIVTIKVSGSFIDRVNFLMFHKLTELGEKSKEIIDRLKSGEDPQSPEEEHIQILASLVKTTTLAAKEADQMSYKPAKEAFQEVEKFLAENPDIKFPIGS